MIGILGGHGFIGSAIAVELRSQGIPYRVLRRSERDYYQTDDLSAWLRENHIEFLINSAGFTGKPNVDACEVQKTQCMLGNAVLPGIVREACESIGIPFGHVSSGCIYTGCKLDGSGFTESDPPNFCFRTNHCSFYSGCKSLGEEIIDGCESCYVWRLRIPFDEFDGQRNYFSKLMRYSTLLDATNSLSHLGDFAKSCVICVVNQLPFGIYNLTNPGSVTTREVTEMLSQTIAMDHRFRFFADEVEFMSLAAVAPRSNCILDASKAVSHGLPMRPIRDALQQTLANWKTETVLSK
ncbi:sugar nucleotide-binding protein [Neorhodopirellula pilleata]|uniref:dTDP-4-dehydrorhamnose reductase n=1 Tax=Neorhodopirellula pilleata TaxID=2714738 RepID=A0A5C5ZFW7_9BACT|nr:sugar nucleotide-binding protein [Neorhodopirellula pilleata]TWT86088.1 dTDP-4-dehydrorhamnose reductase [Neorhodopirellula pilleata]